MSTSSKVAEAWKLPAQVTCETVPALFQQYADQPATIRQFDLQAVTEMDSAGVAMLHWFRRRQRELGLIPADIISDTVGRYQALCLAHRSTDTAHLPP